MSNNPSAFEDWQLIDEDTAKPTSLVVRLRRRTYVLPYFRFVYAEGDDSLVRILFCSHIVTVTGSGLSMLLEGMASSAVVRMTVPTESEAHFGVRGASARQYSSPSIHDISVEQPE